MLKVDKYALFGSIMAAIVETTTTAIDCGVLDEKEAFERIGEISIQNYKALEGESESN